MPGTTDIGEFVQRWRKVAFDSNVLIGLLENTDYSEKAIAFFDAVQQYKAELWTSTMTIPEVLTMPMHRGKDTLVRQYERALFSNTLTFAKIDERSALVAARLGSVYNLQIRDALHIASLINAGVRGFVTADQDFKAIDEIHVFIINTGHKQRHR